MHEKKKCIHVIPDSQRSTPDGRRQLLPFIVTWATRFAHTTSGSTKGSTTLLYLILFLVTCQPRMDHRDARVYPKIFCRKKRGGGWSSTDSSLDYRCTYLGSPNKPFSCFFERFFHLLLCCASNFFILLSRAATGAGGIRLLWVSSSVFWGFSRGFISSHSGCSPGFCGVGCLCLCLCLLRALSSSGG